ncbi:MAG: M56 family metallopeptidase [Lachnospiraceae bacterium]|nr:M56 family metallopeptidase [bacterium]MDY5517632.1 M56 family metallopeptidase [Lachnospiraceae bacterium]
MIDTILKMSATGAVVICIVLVLRLCLRRVPKNFSYVLWLIVLFRLLCPVSVALPVSVFNLISSAQNSISEKLPVREHPVNGEAIPAKSVGITGEESGASKEDVVTEESSVSEHLAESQAAMEVTSLWSWKNIALLIWLIGVCVMAGYAVVSILQLHKKLKHASLDRENIYLLEGISSPFVAGVLRPRIYLPCDLEEKERTYILLHEKTHIRRGDPLFRILAYVALTLHWFNPLVWVAFFQSGRDMEMSCDELVLRRLGEEIRCDYSDSLLAMAQGKRAVGFTPLAFGEGDTGKRIKNVLNYKKVTAQTLVIGVLVVALAGIALGADAVENTPKNRQSQETDGFVEMKNPVPVDTQQDEQPDASPQETSETEGNVPGQDEPEDSAVIATLSVRTISRSARCIDNYVMPDDDWEKNYDSELAFAEDCEFYINSSRTTMDAKEVSFSEFVDAIDAGDPILNKPCIVEIHNDDKLVHGITLISERYMYGVSYATVSEGHLYSGAMFGDANGDPLAVYPAFYGSLEPLRTEHMDIAATPGEETIAIYSGVADGGSHGDVFIRDADGNLLYHYAVNDSGRCWQNLYVGRIDGAGDPYLLELNLENRETSGEYSFYVYSLGAQKGAFTQIAGSRIEWNQTGSLIYDPDEMLMFFHELGHYLHNSHLFVGMEELKIRTEPVCDEDHYTYVNFAPKCFPDPYEGMDVR